MTCCSSFLSASVHLEYQTVRYIYNMTQRSAWCSVKSFLAELWGEFAAFLRKRRPPLGFPDDAWCAQYRRGIWSWQPAPPPLINAQSWMLCCLYFPEISNYFFVFLCQVVWQYLHSLSARCFVIVWNQTHHCCVICIFDDDTGAVGVGTAVSTQGIHYWTKDATLGCT